jgi:hypothetical protein
MTFIMLLPLRSRPGHEAPLEIDETTFHERHNSDLWRSLTSFGIDNSLGLYEEERLAIC